MASIPPTITVKVDAADAIAKLEALAARLEAIKTSIVVTMAAFSGDAEEAGSMIRTAIEKAGGAS